MKIEKISVKNMIAAREFEILMRTPVALICGANEAGKSSICEGIKHALTGESTRVHLKKDYKFLVNDNDQVGYAYVEFDEGKRACITLPNGTHELKEQLHAAMPYVLDPQLFADLSSDDKRKLLFSLSNIKNNGNGVKEKLLERGCNPEKVERIIPYLMSGFDNAQKEAQTKSKDSKTAWRVVTGETYGEKKAETWKSDANGNINEIRELIMDKEKELLAADSNFETMNQQFGAMQASRNSSVARNAEIVRLSVQAEKLDRIKTKLARDRQELSIWTVKVEDAKRVAVGSHGKNVVCKCPECDAEVMFDGVKLVKLQGDLHGDEEVAAKLPEYEQSLTIFRNAVTNGERDLVNAEFAIEKLKDLEKESADVTSDETIAEMQSKVDALKTSRKLLNDTINNLLTEEKSLRDSENKTLDAKKHHVDCVEWDFIADALSPNGIPGEMLSFALDPFNARLAKNSEYTSWKAVSLDKDMALTCDGRPYSLSSESAKWRADAMIAETISYLSGIRFFALDRFDVLDLSNRGDLIFWIDSLSANKEVDSCLIFGTLKSLPGGLPPTISAYWIENGILQLEEKAA